MKRIIPAFAGLAVMGLVGATSASADEQCTNAVMEASKTYNADLCSLHTFGNAAEERGRRVILTGRSNALKAVFADAVRDNCQVADLADLGGAGGCAAQSAGIEAFIECMSDTIELACEYTQSQIWDRDVPPTPTPRAAPEPTVIVDGPAPVVTATAGVSAPALPCQRFIGFECANSENSGCCNRSAVCAINRRGTAICTFPRPGIVTVTPTPGGGGSTPTPGGSPGTPTPGGSPGTPTPATPTPEPTVAPTPSPAPPTPTPPCQPDPQTGDCRPL